jgi:hypothetical protein
LVKVDTLVKSPPFVTPAKLVPEGGRRGAGVQKSLKILDSRLRGNDRKRHFRTFYESVKVGWENNPPPPPTHPLDGEG